MIYTFKTYSEEKLHGKVYTPNFIVKKILNDVGYTGKDIIGKYILEPACGDGQFLREIVQRVCTYSNENNILHNLQYIYGFDIDENAIKVAIKKLNEIVLSHFSFLSEKDIRWNISCQNTLFLNANDLLSPAHIPFFDYIVGNPPYIRIQHLSAQDGVRQFIQKNFQFCKKGSTDIFIAFFEWAYHHLNENGKCAFITPNTYFYTETARPVRQFFEQHKNIIQITNYNDIQLFPNKSTYTAITIFGKKRLNTFKYQNAITEKILSDYIIPYPAFINQKRWNFNDIIQSGNNQKKSQISVRLSEIADIHVGLTTLCDKFYILEKINDKDDVYCEVYSRLAGEMTIEKEILRPILKASRPKQWHIKKEYILFPYYLENGKYKIISEQDLQKKFPLAYDYFVKYRDNLNQRDKGKPNPVSWYAFGRHQGLQTSFGEKILFSNMMKEPQFIYVRNPHFTFYSGYCIKLKSSAISYAELLHQLNSERMKEFVAHQSRSFRDGWKAYNKKVIEDFEIYLP